MSLTRYFGGFVHSQVDHAAEATGRLEAEEPALAVRQVDEPALVRAAGDEDLAALHQSSRATAISR